MKVAFIGTHGVGKTTLCYELAARLKKVGLDADIVKEVARSSPLPINQSTTLSAQLWILHTQIAREIEVGARSEVVVCDRSVLDNYAYLRQASGRQMTTERLVESWIRSYDLLFRVPATGRISMDGVRDLDPAFQRAIDRQIQALIRQMHVDVHELAGLGRNRWITSACAATVACIRGEPMPVSDKIDDQLDLFR
ncbi:MAG: hypothetical protein CME06_08040 [Gemmatimonadetes bacterium]|nr:hypothetical protein [Gemmatimonadota bacterium]